MGLFSRKQQKKIDLRQENIDSAELANAKKAGENSDSFSENADNAANLLKNNDFTRVNGPFDATELTGIGERLDAGALWLPIVPEAQIQFSTDESQENIIGVVYLIADSALQLQPFAAPKSSGIWEEVRLDMRTSVAKQGGSSTEVSGPFGTELNAMMPLAGAQNFAPHRFLGIDGPRWLLRATLYGRAGADQTAAAPLLEILQNVAVYRGSEPIVPRSLLPLKLPHLERS